MATGIVYKTRKLNKDSLIVEYSQLDNISLPSGLQDLNVPLNSVEGYEPLVVTSIRFWNASSGGTGVSSWVPRSCNISGSVINCPGRNYSTGSIKIAASIGILYKRIAI